MTDSFQTTRRFFDDKNYPRGFSRHGDYTIRESEILEQYGLAFQELEQGTRKPKTKEEKNFVAFCNGKHEPNTPFEKAWAKYRDKISNIKRVYTLSGTVTDINDDFAE